MIHSQMALLPKHLSSCISNRLSSTIGGNREMNQLYTTSQVSNGPTTKTP